MSYQQAPRADVTQRENVGPISAVSRQHPRSAVPLLGVEVTPLPPAGVVRSILDSARAGQGLLVGNLNLHGVYMYHVNARFAEYCDRSDLVLIDGAPLAWAARRSTTYRVGSTDWLDMLMPRADGLNILALGGTPETAQATERLFRQRYPNVGWTSVDGYGGEVMDDGLREKIAAAHIVLVGMGMPRQESWILEHFSDLASKVVANVGGCFDYYAGTQRLAPRWLGRLGLEWLYRLAADPGRLAHRYLVEPLVLMSVLLRRGRRRQRRGPEMDAR